MTAFGIIMSTAACALGAGAVRLVKREPVTEADATLVIGWLFGSLFTWAVS